MLKRYVFKCFLNIVTLGEHLIPSGKVFHSVAADVIHRKHVGICDDELNLIVSYLSDRKQQVQIDKIMSYLASIIR